MRDIVTVTEFAAVFRVTEKTVLAWIDNGMQPHKRGGQGRGNAHRTTMAVGSS